MRYLSPSILSFFHSVVQFRNGWATHCKLPSSVIFCIAKNCHTSLGFAARNLPSKSSYLLWRRLTIKVMSIPRVSSSASELNDFVETAEGKKEYNVTALPIDVHLCSELTLPFKPSLGIQVASDFIDQLGSCAPVIQSYFLPCFHCPRYPPNRRETWTIQL